MTKFPEQLDESAVESEAQRISLVIQSVRCDALLQF